MQTMNVRMPDGTLLKNVPVGTTKAEIDAKYSAFRQTKEQPKEDSSILGELGKGVVRGGLQTGALLYEGLPAVAKILTGQDASTDAQELVDALNKIENDPNFGASVKSYKDVNSVGSALEYGAGAVGSVASDLAAGLGAGALVKAGAKTGAKALGKELSKEAADKAFVGGVIGSAAATEAPSTVASTFSETGETPGAINLITTTAAKSLLEKVGDMSFLEAARKAGNKGVIRSTFEAALKQAGIEGTTEGLQQVADEISAEFTNPAKANFDMDQVVESVLQGAIGGGIIGGGIGAINAATQPTNQPTQEQINAALPTEELPSEEVSSTPPPIEPTETKTPSANEIFSQAVQSTTPKKQETPVTLPTEEIGVSKPLDTPLETPVSSLKPVSTPKLTTESFKPLKTSDITASSLQSPVGYKFNTNALNSKQASYAKLTNDLAQLVGVNVPLDVVFKTGEQGKTQDFFNGFDQTDDYQVKLRDGVANKLSELGDKTAAAFVPIVDTQGKGRMAILLDDTNKSPADLGREIYHELSHGILRNRIMTDPKMLTPVLADYNKTARKANKKGLTPQEFKNYVSSYSFDNKGTPVGTAVGIDKGFQARFKQGQSNKDQDYYLSFDEYVAEGIARALQRREEATNIVDKYFKSLAAMLRKLASFFQEQGFYPNDTFDQIVDRLIAQTKARPVANNYMTRGPEAAIADLRAWHGGPHWFTQFTTEKIGTGEGVQAFGWGLYFTSKRAIAEYYRDKLSNPDRMRVMDKQGNKYDWLDILDYARNNNLFTNNDEKDSLRTAFRDLEQHGFKKALTQNEEFLRIFKERKPDQWISSEAGKEQIADQERIIKYLKFLNSKGFSKQIPNKGALYEVEIPEESEMLDWDKPLREQSTYLLEKIKNFDERLSEKGLEIVGSQLYQMLIERLEKSNNGVFYLGGFNFSRRNQNSPKDVSLALNSLGIKGIKYKAGQLSTGTSDGTNYVIFDDASIVIRNVFDSPEFQVSDMRRAPKTEEVKDNNQYKYVNKPHAIQHEEGFRSITGEGDGTIRTYDKQGNITGELVYSKDKNKVTIDNIDLKQKGQRHRQDTTYALMDYINKAGIAPVVEASPAFKPYQDAYQTIQRNQAPKPEVKVTPKKQPDVTHVKPVPLFSKNVLTRMSSKMQNLFKSLPKDIGTQVAMVDSIIDRGPTFEREIRFAMMSPEALGLTKGDIKVLLDNKDTVVKFISDNFRQGVDSTLLSQQRLEDVIPYAYDAYIEAKQKGTLKFDTSLNSDITAIFDKVFDKVDNLKNEFTNNGVTKLEDIYYIPTTFEPTSISTLANEYFDSIERTNRLNTFEAQASYDDMIKTGVGAGKVGAFEGFMKYVSPAVQAAKNSPLVGRIFNIGMARREHMLTLQSKLMGMLKPSIIKYEKTPEVFDAMVGVIESNRLNGFKGFIDDQGYFNYVNRDGKRARVMDKEKSQEIDNIRNIFEAIRRERVEVMFAHRDTQELLRGVGLPYSPTITQINSVLKNNGQKLTASQVKNLESLKSFLEVQAQLQSRDYVPFTRSGTHGVTFKRKTADGKKETVAFSVYEKDSKGRPIMDTRWQEYQNMVKKYAGEEGIEVSQEFELTKDALIGQITNKEMTIDIIEQLVDIMSKGVKSSEQEAANTMPAWKALGEILVDDVMKKGFNAALKEAKNIDGYRRNWFNVVPVYLQGASFALSNQRFAPLIRYALRASQTSDATPTEKEYAKKYGESLLNVEPELMNNLRNIQFNFALGFNISSAMIQLTSFTTLMPGVLTTMTNSPMRAYRHLAKATNDASSFFRLTKDGFYDLSPENVRTQGKKLGWTEDKINYVIRLGQQGYLTQTLSIEEIGSDIHDTSTFAGRLAKQRDNITRYAGAGLRLTEELSRMSQAIAMYDALDNPVNLNRFHNIIYKDSAAYRDYLKTNPNIVGADREYLLKNGMNLALALFGKEGRAPFQNTYFQFVFPFATYPWQAFLNYYRLMKSMGPEGRKGAMVASVGIVTGAGLIGLPGVFLLKEMLELVLSQVFEEDVDLDKEALLWMNEQKDVNPWTYNTAQYLYRGGISSFTNTDLNERLQFQTPADVHLSNLMEFIRTGKWPSNALESSTGVIGGSVILAPVNALEKYRESGGSLLQTINVMMPVAIRNLISSNFIEPEQGKSILGTQVLTQPEAAAPTARIGGSLGFKSANEGLNEEQARAQFQAQKAFDVFKTTYARRLQRFYKEMERNNTPEATERFNKARDAYIDFMVRKGYDATSIRSSLLNLVKEAQTDVLSEQDKELNRLLLIKGSPKVAREEIEKLVRSQIEEVE